LHIANITLHYSDMNDGAGENRQAPRNASTLTDPDDDEIQDDSS
jgi:hypothetical protein